jgi:hypothetical protein
LQSGNPASKNIQGQFYLDDILTHPDTIMKPNKFGGWDHYAPDGGGVRFNAEGYLRGFIEP